MIVGEAIQRVESMYSKGVQSKNTRLVKRHIYSALLTAKATMLSQLDNKRQSISDMNYQKIQCLEFTPSNINPLLPKSSVLRTVHKIPKIISSINGLMIKSFTTIDGNISFDRTTFKTRKHTSGLKYTSNIPRFYIENGYGWITVQKGLQVADLVAAFYDPIEAATLPTLCACDDCNCKDVTELDFYLDSRLEDGVFKLAYAELLTLFSQMKEDKSSNASDDNDARANVSYRQSDNNNGQEQ